MNGLLYAMLSDGNHGGCTRQARRWRSGHPLIGLLGMIVLAVVLAGFGLNAYAAEPVETLEVPALQRIALTREAQRIWGPRAPVARFAAQIHAESSWRPIVCSRVGACGLAQFMRPTAKWLAELYPEDLAPVAVEDWRWSVRALVIYNRHLYQSETGWRSDSDRWAATLTSYVGGGGWVRRERRSAEAVGLPSDRWWHGVESHCLRSQLACRESRHYPRRILCELEPSYARAGWPGQPLGACP